MKAIINRASLVVMAIVFIGISASAQLLNKTLSIDVRNQRLDNVLEILSNKGAFYFSYNSNIIKKDSLVTFSAANRSVRQILEMLLPDHYEFKESGNYIIIRKAPIQLTFITNKAVTEDKFYTVSGYVLDDQTGYWIPNASIYEASLLASTLTNAQGYFKLRLKQKHKSSKLTVSKEFYQDTSFSIDPGYNQQITVTLLPETSGSVTIISPEDYFAPEQLKLRVQKDSVITEYTYTLVDSTTVDKTSMSRFLVSSRQRIQSLNLKKFFTTRPFQVSFVPGLSSQGKMSGQVINNFSLNVLGGYTGGVNGVEIGGIFNINKKGVQYGQAAGVFNITGGYVKGIQIAGVNNTVLDSVHAFQVAGVNNHVTGKFSGVQLAGVYNHVADSVRGVQVAGVANFARRKVSGSQFAGVINFANQTITGSQVGGVINYAKHIKGLQLGLINISDTSEGFAIGLITVVVKGYHKLSFFSDEVVNANVAFKTGHRKFYNILHAGMNFSDSNEVFTFGYGIGSEFRLGKWFSLNPEITAQHLYLGSWNYANILSKGRLNLNINLGKKVSLFGGPLFNVYYSEQSTHFTGYRSAVPPSGYNTYNYSDQVKAWVGWNAGINFF